MGFFRKLLGDNKAERMAAEETKSHYESCMKRAKELLNSVACQREQPRFGDWMLGHQQADPAMAARLKKLRTDGVTDADIRWWWNLPPLEAAYIVAEDEHFREASFIAFQRQGMTPEQAIAEVWKGHAKYSPNYPDDPASGGDRPIRIELRKRIMRYLERNKQTGNAEAWRIKMDTASSLNALIRSEIRKGNL